MKTTWTEILYRWDGEKHVLVYEQGFPDDREVAELKGEDKAAEQMRLQNSLVKQQLDQQNKQYADIWSNFSKYMSGNIGFDPQQLALMKSQFLNQAAGGYQDAGRNLRTALLRRGAGGGDQPVGGDYTRGIAALEGGQADTVAGGLANIDLSNLQQAITNKFNTGSLLSGNSAQLSNNIGTFNQGAGSALSDYIKAKNSSVFGQIMGGFGSGLGNALGNWATGGGGGKSGGCWVAAAVFDGWDDPRTQMVRNWLHTDFSTSKFGRFVVSLYMKYGERVAEMVRKYRPVRWVMTKIFNKALACAMGE